MKKRNKNIYLFRKILLMIIPLIIVFLVYILFIKVNDKEAIVLSKLGYNNEQIKTIKKLTDDDIQLIIDNPYKKYMPDLIISQYFIKDNLNRYIGYYGKHQNLSIKALITYVNSNRDYDYYTHVANSDINKENLILTNKYNKLSTSYQPDHLVNINSEYGNGQIKKEVYDAYLEMIQSTNNNTLKIYARSNYRSYDNQTTIYNNYVKKDGQKVADTYSARPGYSEHQTGLAMDIVTRDSDFDTFVNTAAFTWLKSNAYKYGFILRYPKNAEDITGYIYEPWHYRYVGKEVAKYIYNHNLTFDEYYAYFVKSK